jgi:hypothetical protein
MLNKYCITGDSNKESHLSRSVGSSRWVFYQISKLAKNHGTIARDGMDIKDK